MSLSNLSNQELIFIVNAVSEFSVKEIPAAKIKGDVLSKVTGVLLTPPKTRRKRESKPAK